MNCDVFCKITFNGDERLLLPSEYISAAKHYCECAACAKKLDELIVKLNENLTLEQKLQWDGYSLYNTLKIINKMEVDKELNF